VYLIRRIRHKSVAVQCSWLPRTRSNGRRVIKRSYSAFHNGVYQCAGGKLQWLQRVSDTQKCIHTQLSSIHQIHPRCCKLAGAAGDAAIYFSPNNSHPVGYHLTDVHASVSNLPTSESLVIEIRRSVRGRTTLKLVRPSEYDATAIDHGLANKPTISSRTSPVLTAPLTAEWILVTRPRSAFSSIYMQHGASLSSVRWSLLASKLQEH